MFKEKNPLTQWPLSGLQHLTECARGRPSALAGKIAFQLLQETTVLN